MKKILMLGMLVLSPLSWGDSDCDYHLSLSNATVQVLDASQTLQQQISVYRGALSSNKNCNNYRIFFSKGLANSYQRKAFSLWGSSINYNLHSNINQSGILKDYGDALTSAEFLSGTANDRYTTYNNQYFVSVPGIANGTVKSGTFLDIVQVSVYSLANNGKYIFEETLGLTTIYIIPKIIQISLIDENGTFDPSATTKVLDFGILAKGQEKGADLRIVSNSSYRVSVSSSNAGALKSAGGSLIKYSMKVNGSGVSLSNSTTLGSGDETDATGDRYNLKFQITDDTGNLPAGLYQDNLTITATAN
jgi:hypothetical protein